MIAENFSLELKEIADNLEKERIKIYNEKVVPWETDKEFVDSWLVRIVTLIDNVAEYVKYMSFEKDSL